MSLATYSQAVRPLAVTTPLGADVLLLVALHAQESLSRLFRFELELVAPNRTAVPFDRLMGQKMAVELRRTQGPSRFFHGLVCRFSQGATDLEFTHYHAELVPDLWLLTRRSRSRIFQHRSVPEILQQVFEGLDVSYQVHGKFHPRDYCVQYRESDFDFASRLMEEEGLFYFFRHHARGHQMVVGDSPQTHPEIAAGPVPYASDRRSAASGEQVTTWRKVQELRSGKWELWDHCFELPHAHLDARKPIQDELQVGQTTHRLSAGLNGKLEVYDYPGGYAQRFDGVDRGGGEQPAELQKIFEDNQRTVGIRAQQEAAAALVIHGEGTCPSFLPGHQVMLTGHRDGDGPYVLTHVEHRARQPGYASADRGAAFTYSNTFDCIPLALPYRPARVTPRPTIHGTQTATVVGPSGYEIFVDKYGRVKVQLPWDREGRNDADSSCWVRVAQAWAGRMHGAYFWPRVGSEVVVGFEEGDPDRPILLGSVYNAENMPPYPLPEGAHAAGWTTHSTPGGGENEFNELTFYDQKGDEIVYLRAQRDFTRDVLNDDVLWVGGQRQTQIEKNRTTAIGGDDDLTVSGKRQTKINQDRSTTVGGDDHTTVTGSATQKAGMTQNIEAPSVYLEGKQFLQLKCGGSTISLTPGGIYLEAAEIRLNGKDIFLEGTGIILDAPIILGCGIVQCQAVLCGVISATKYSPGVGNLM